MTYTKNTPWVNGDATRPLNAARLNHVEDGLFTVAATADSAADAALAAQGDATTALTGVDALDTLTTTGRLSETQLSATIVGTFGYVPIAQFVEPGEDLLLDGSGDGSDNTTIFQRAVDWCNAQWMLDGVPRKIQFPPGAVMKLDRAGVEPVGGGGYSVRWKSGVGIASNGDPYTLTFVADTAATPFHAAKSFGSIQHVYVDAHRIDGSLQTNSVYTTSLKGWFIQDLNHFRFRDILIENTWATGFGCDFLRDGTVTGVARGCGRGIVEKGIDPFTTSGGSGFGIGTGLYDVEDFTLDVAAYGCGFHGVFTETQALYLTSGDITHPFTRGSRIRAFVQGNYVGFRDCGSDGLVSDITAVSNTYANILHDATVLAPAAGINGVCRAVMQGGARGLLLGVCGAGPYSFDVQASGHTGDGILTKTGGSLGSRIKLRGSSFNNGGRGLTIGLSSIDLDLDVRTWGNTGGGMILSGTTLTAAGVRVGGDYRSDGAVVQQAITGDYRIDARGLSATAPYGLGLAASGSTSLIVTWTAPLITDGITDYSVQYRKVGDTAWTTFSHAASTATTQTITGLDAGDLYEVRVASVTGAGTSAYAAAFGTTGALLMGDTFNRADTSSVGLGTMDSGSSPVSYSGGLAWNILNNRAYASVSTPVALTTFNTGVVVRAIEFTLTAFGTGTAQVYLRGTTTGASVAIDKSTSAWRLIKNNATVLLTTDAVPAVGDVVRVVCLTGGVYRMFVNGQFKGTVTDAQSATDTNAGLRGISPTSIDNLKVYA